MDFRCDGRFEGNVAGASSILVHQTYFPFHIHTPTFTPS